MSLRAGTQIGARGLRVLAMFEFSRTVLERLSGCMVDGRDRCLDTDLRGKVPEASNVWRPKVRAAGMRVAVCLGRNLREWAGVGDVR